MLIFNNKKRFFTCLSLRRRNHIHIGSSIKYVFFRYYGIFWIKLLHIQSYFTAYKNSRTKRAQKKTCFSTILQILKPPSVAMCCLNVDLYLSYHKHIPKLPIALSRVSKSLLDRFLDTKT